MDFVESEARKEPEAQLAPAPVTNADAVAMLRASIDAHDQAITETREHLRSQPDDREVLAKALHIVERQGGVAIVSTATSPALATSIRAVPEDIDLSGITVDFEGAKNLQERVLRVAEAAPGLYLNVTRAARFLIARDATQASLHNTRVGVQRVFEVHPEQFEKVRAATCEYLGGVSSAGPDPDAAHQSDPDPDPDHTKQEDQPCPQKPRPPRP